MYKYKIMEVSPTQWKVVDQEGIEICVCNSKEAAEEICNLEKEYKMARNRCVELLEDKERLEYEVKELERYTNSLIEDLDSIFQVVSEIQKIRSKDDIIRAIERCKKTES